ncbi:hypothetical protein [Paenibacillus aestuarii]|uniref:Uncharacterized protein n=1 Tax=Paenibacillus aestuarii TaxID=516965 RepID=A0ABW0KCM9_9BACL|nr:hypothetical protein [Paenibacillus aestuarii]
MNHQKLRKIILTTAVTSIVLTMPLSAFAATKVATTHPTAAQQKAVHRSVNSVQSQKKSLEAQLSHVQKSIENTKKLLEKAKQRQQQAKISKYEKQLQRLEAFEKNIQTKLAKLN